MILTLRQYIHLVACSRFHKHLAVWELPMPSACRGHILLLVYVNSFTFQSPDANLAFLSCKACDTLSISVARAAMWRALQTGRPRWIGWAMPPPALDDPSRAAERARARAPSGPMGRRSRRRASRAARIKRTGWNGEDAGGEGRSWAGLGAGHCVHGESAFIHCGGGSFPARAPVSHASTTDGPPSSGRPTPTPTTTSTTSPPNVNANANANVHP